MESVWVALIGAVAGLLTSAILLWMKNRSELKERVRIEAREDAREARTQAALELIKKQTDGVIAQVTALAKSSGRIEGVAETTKAADATAATLALGQAQGRDAERESIASKLKNDGDQPVPVVDKVTNETGERAAKALEAMATTAKEVAEKKKE